MSENEILQTILTELQELKQGQVAIRLDVEQMKGDISQLKDDVAEIKEDTAITRSAVNSLLDWADDKSIQEIPLSMRRKAK